MGRVRRGLWSITWPPTLAVPPWWWGIILRISLVSGVWGSLAQDLPRVSLQSCIFPTSQPPSPIPISCGQYSSASLHVDQNENGVELPGETIWCPLGHYRLSVFDSKQHSSQNIDHHRPDHLPTCPPTSKKGERRVGGGIWGVALRPEVRHIQTPVSADDLFISDI